MISVLLPARSVDYAAQLELLIKNAPLPTFDPLVIEFIDAVSKRILLDRVTSRMPEMAAVAYWMRKAHILETVRACEAQRGSRIHMARGLVVHFAPSNVDSIFLYSWFLSLLAGNANIMRLSQRRRDEVGLLLDRINEVIEETKFHSIKIRNLILAYDHDDAVTASLSKVCQMRVLWGGDESISRLRAVPLNPLATEAAFPSRFSLGLLNSAKVISLDGDGLRQLAQRFYNDSYWFDQMACSSPRLIVWVGEESESQLAQRLFWSNVQEVVEEKKIAYPEIVGINKLVAAYTSAGFGFSDSVENIPTCTVARVHLVSNPRPGFREIECGGGLFFEAEIHELNTLPALLTERDQTISYFGFDNQELRRLVAAFPARAVDRVVPIGSALNFSSVWDGINLLDAFCREIDIQ